MSQRIITAILAAAVEGALLGAGTARGQEAAHYRPAPAIIPAAAGVFGLYLGTDFRLTRGDCKDCATPKQALWYCRDDLVAVPSAHVKAADFSPGLTAQADVKSWYANAKEEDLKARPPMLWMGSPRLVRDARLSAAGDAITLGDGANLPFRVTPKIKTNLSFYNDSSKAFYQQRLVRMRGEMQGDTFVARTLWPQDWAIDETQMKLQPLQANESLLGLVRQHANGKDERFETRLLREKTPAAARDWSGRAVIGIMLNGAQGDDDEADQYGEGDCGVSV